MANSGRLIATLAYKAAGAIPRILYLGYDAEDALKALELAKDKGYFEVLVCRNIDLNWTNRFKAEPVKV